MRAIATALALLATALPLASAAEAKPRRATAAKTQPPVRADLADVLVGTWHGDVISDSRGSSRSDVTLTITKVDRNTIRISSDYARLPVISVPIERAMDKIVQRSGDSGIFYDPAKSPPQLDVNFQNLAAWAGTRHP